MIEKYGKVQTETFKVVDQATNETIAETQSMDEALEVMEKKANCRIEVES